MAAFFVVASPRPSEAAAPPETEDDPAALFSQAETLYLEGRYEETIEILEALIETHEEPILRFNLGRAYESAGLLDPAIDAYRQYLEAAQDAPDRASVEARIDRLEERIPSEGVPKPALAQVEQPPPEPSESVAPRPVIAPWVMAGAGGIVLIAGGVLGGISRARATEAEDPATDQVRALDAWSEARSFGRVAIGALIIGGALVLAGVTWGVVATTGQRRRRRIGMSMTGLTVSF